MFFLVLTFILLSLFTLACALGVVVAKNVFHAALFLVGVFFGIAGLYVLLEAEFLAAAQIMVYVGAISILIIFAIMLSRGYGAEGKAGQNNQWGLAAIISVLLFLVVALDLWMVKWPVVSLSVPGDAISQIGSGFVGKYMLPFEVASVLLLVALVGAIIIARERE